VTSPSHPVHRDSDGLPPGPNSLFERGVKQLRERALLPEPSYPRSPKSAREPLAGTTVHTPPDTLGHFRPQFPQFTGLNQRLELGTIQALFRLTSEGSLVRTQLRPPSF
jgi:hypothetical protein